MVSMVWYLWRRSRRIVLIMVYMAGSRRIVFIMAFMAASRRIELVMLFMAAKPPNRIHYVIYGGEAAAL